MLFRYMLDMKSALKLILEKRIQEKGLQEFFGASFVPSAKLKPFFDADEHQDQQLVSWICS